MSVPTALPVAPKAAAPSVSASTKDAPADGAPQFSDLLDAGTRRLNAEAPASGAAIAATNPAADTAESRLAAKIDTLLASGVSYATIVQTIAKQLAAKAAPNADADLREKIAAQIAAALAPPGESPPPRADGARALAARLRSIAEQLAGATAGDSGQQQRRLGTVSDAESAREHPAPSSQTNQPDGLLAALSALASGSGSGSAAPASAVAGRASKSPASGASVAAGTPLQAPLADSPLQAAPPASAAPANGASAPASPAQLAATAASAGPASFVATLAGAAADGRRAASGDRALLSPGGNTLLGRMLVRAQNCAPAAPVPAAAAAPPPSPPSQGATAASILSAFESMVASIEAPPAALPEQLRVRAAAPAADASASPIGVSTSSASASNVAPSVAPAAPAPAADPYHVIDQMIHAVSVRTLGTQSEIRLRLVPEHLGDVTVKLVVNGDAVNASLLAHSADARDALVGGAPALNRALADAGLKLHTFSVDLSGGGSGGFPQRHDGAPTHSSTARHIAFASDDDVELDALAAVPSFAPPDAAAGRGAHNYLV